MKIDNASPLTDVLLGFTPRSLVEGLRDSMSKDEALLHLADHFLKSIALHKENIQHISTLEARVLKLEEAANGYNPPPEDAKPETQITWLYDNDRNKCSVEHFGSMEAAQEALNSLKDCINCVNCVDCKNCTACENCRKCICCVDCTNCYSCWNCNGDTEQNYRDGPMLSNIHKKE